MYASNLPTLDRMLLVEQRTQMQEYAKTLSLRYFMAFLKHKQ